MGTTSQDARHDAQDFSTLPDPIRLEDMITTQETQEVPDPAMGRDADTEWLLRYGAG